MSGVKSQPRRWMALSVLGVVAVAGSAMAQGPGFRPTQVVSPPNLNPTVLRATTNYPTRFVPGLYVPPTIAPTLWGPAISPGAYQSPLLIQRDPGRYLRQANGMYWNPWTNGAYSPYTDTFHFPGRIYSFNPWTGNYMNWGSGAQYNPRTGTFVSPVNGPVFNGGFYNPWLFR